MYCLLLLVVSPLKKADPSPVSRGEGCLGPGAGVVSERKRRLIERRARDDSTSQVSNEFSNVTNNKTATANI